MTPPELFALIARFVLSSGRRVSYVVRGWVGGVAVGYLMLPGAPTGAEWWVFGLAAVVMAVWIVVSLIIDFNRSRETF